MRVDFSISPLPFIPTPVKTHTLSQARFNSMFFPRVIVYLACSVELEASHVVQKVDYFFLQHGKLPIQLNMISFPCCKKSSLLFLQHGKLPIQLNMINKLWHLVARSLPSLWHILHFKSEIAVILHQLCKMQNACRRLAITHTLPRYQT